MERTENNEVACIHDWDINDMSSSDDDDSWATYEFCVHCGITKGRKDYDLQKD